MVTPASISTAEAWKVLSNITDPEIPVLSIVDLGIVRRVEMKAEGLEVDLTPTYSGCPAIDVIKTTVHMELSAAGFDKIRLTQVLSPAWTTDWMTEEGRKKLKAYGIAPPEPQQSVCSPGLFNNEVAIQCPQCNSYHTRLLSEFGSTACKSLYQCQDCLEPFDYFKCH